MSGTVKKVIYLTNRDLLEEIHKSKNSYSEFTDKKYENYDFIVTSLDQVTPERLEQAQQKKVADRISRIKKEYAANGVKNYKPVVDIAEFPLDEIVIRLMTFDHIPPNPNEEKLAKAKTTSERHIRCNFPPFQHYIFQAGEFKLVGQSHYKDGEFSLTHGKMTNRLAKMFMMLVEKYGHRGNWRNYTYLDEMKGQALLQLSQVGLQFDESRSDSPNPFSYFTTVLKSSFIRNLNLEKRNQDIRDDLLIMSGAMPSYTRQTENDIQNQKTTAEHKSKKAAADTE